VVNLARLHLYNRGLVCGAQAIDWELEEWGVHPRPSLRRQSLAFEQKHNTRYRYSKLKGQTPEMALKQCQAQIHFPASLEAPPHPLAKPEKGRFHLVRFIWSDRRLDGILGTRTRTVVTEHSF
jgi:hypothetical protein